MSHGRVTKFAPGVRTNHRGGRSAIQLLPPLPRALVGKLALAASCLASDLPPVRKSDLRAGHAALAPGTA